jgi:hypothetical protein
MGDSHNEAPEIYVLAGPHMQGRGFITAPRDTFNGLVDQWLEDTEFLSNLTQIHMHPAYQRIIGMGPSVLPLIFERLAGAPGHWFWALASITGEDPARGTETMSAARAKWLEWAHERGYVAAHE